MKLPNAERGHVEREKVVAYLLNREHPDGRSKALFFERFGFRATRWRQLAVALRNQAIQSPVSKKEETLYGTRYVVDGPIQTPTGDEPHVRTVWIVEQGRGASRPRLVTAYPIAPNEPKRP